MAPGTHSPTIRNRRARHDYFVLSTVEAGIVLEGCEVKSIRQGNASLAEAYARIDETGEAWLIGMHVSPYRQTTQPSPSPTRPRKLLLSRQELRRLRREVEHRGRTLVPLDLHFTRGRVKVELGLCVGKKLHDKRETIMARDQERQAQREFAGRGKP